MARATLEMFLKLIGADKTSKDLDKVSGSANRLDKNVKNSSKANAQFAAGMSGLTKGAIAGAAIFAGKALIDFSADALEAAVSAEEAAAAFGTTFGNAAQDAARFTDEFANKAGLTSAELKQLLATTGAVAQGIGFTQKESADLGIELTKIAADVASFSNISAGAEPVLLAFRSALLGEREALKTYGIAISEAEVQTKAFEQTGKDNANALTRQEKAYATLAVIQQKAAVQIGDLDRTSESFANQQRAVSAEIRQLKEDIGAELIPAAAEMLPIFRELVNDIAPPTINFFKEAALFSADLALSFEALSLKAERLQNNFPKINAGLERYINFLMRITPQGRLLKNIDELAESQRKLDIRTNDTAETLIQQSIAQGLANKEANKYRRVANILIPLNKKFGKSIDKDVLPFAEKLAFILNLGNKEIAELTDLQKDRDDATKDLNRALEEEGLITAQEALRKKELQQQIAELTFFQKQGKDVTAELAVAQEELKLVELALTRESDQLTEARKRAAEAQSALDDATNKGTGSMESQLEAAQNLQEVLDLFNSDNFQDEIKEAADVLNITWAEAINGALNKYKELLEATKGQSLMDIVNEQLEGLNLVGLGAEAPAGESVDTPANTLGSQDNVVQSGAGGTGGTTNVEVYIGDEKIEEVVQKVNTRIQNQGKTFAIR